MLQAKKINVESALRLIRVVKRKLNEMRSEEDIMNEFIPTVETRSPDSTLHNSGKRKNKPPSSMLDYAVVEKGYQYESAETTNESHDEKDVDINTLPTTPHLTGFCIFLLLIPVFTKLTRFTEKRCVRCCRHITFSTSAPTTTGKSLNDNLLVGPVVQSELLDIIMRFRLYAVAITADVEKMYRPIWVDRKQRDWQRIVWRKRSEEPHV